jgi:hypothetical protein
VRNARDDDRDDDPRRDDEPGGAAAGCAPPPATGPAGLTPPSGDARTTAPPAAGLAPAGVPAVVPAPTGGATPVPPSTVDGALPAAVATRQATATPPSTVDPLDASSTVDTPAVMAAAGSPADRPAAGDTGAEAGSGRQPEAVTWNPAVAGPRTDAVGPTTSASQTTPAPQAPALPPAAQIALKLAPLRVGPDGTHQLTIHLNPEELGPISVVAQVRGDELSVRLTGTAVGTDAVKAALPQLEQQLRDGGFNTVAVDVREASRFDPALRPAWAGGPAGTATDNATVGTGTTTSGGKTESQPIGQVDHPDGLGNRNHARHDLGTGMYNAAGQTVPGTGQTAAGQHGPGHQQPGNQLNLGQPGNQPDHHGQYGAAGQHDTGGQPGTGRNDGAERPTGRPETGERDQRVADTQPTDPSVSRTVDLRV